MFGMKSDRMLRNSSILNSCGRFKNISSHSAATRLLWLVITGPTGSFLEQPSSSNGPWMYDLVCGRKAMMSGGIDEIIKNA